MMRLLRRVFLHNWGLKLIALGISFFLWATYTAEPFAQVAYNVPVAYVNVPDGLAVGGAPPNDRSGGAARPLRAAATAYAGGLDSGRRFEPRRLRAKFPSASRRAWSACLMAPRWCAWRPRSSTSLWCLPRHPRGIRISAIVVLRWLAPPQEGRRGSTILDMPKELFGTDGIRGVPGEYPLDDQTLYWVGRSIGGYLRLRNQQPRVLIGMDTRESGAHIASRDRRRDWPKKAPATPLRGSSPRPEWPAWCAKRDSAAGVVISASHNPYHDNGVKLFAGSGMKFPDEIEEQTRDGNSAASQRTAASGTAPRLSPDRQLDEDYLEFLRGCVHRGAKLAGMKMVLDCANGAASSLAPALFRSLGADVIAIHDRPTAATSMPIAARCIPEDLQKEVPETRAALGVAFDGDADRAMFVSQLRAHRGRRRRAAGGGALSAFHRTS